jgi:hypothetical protein
MLSRTCRAAAAALPLLLLLLLLSTDAAPSAAAPADGLQLLGISPRHGSARGGELVTFIFAGVSSADFAPALGSTFLGHWPVGERSGRFFPLDGVPDAPPPSGLLNLTATSVARTSWAGPYTVSADSDAWADGWFVLRYAACVNGADSCTFVYDADDEASSPAGAAAAAAADAGAGENGAGAPRPRASGSLRGDGRGDSLTQK